MNSCIYPGTFDPITNGHLDVIERASKLFSKVLVAVAKNDTKKPMFGLETRIQMAQIATKHLPNVEVAGFSGLLIEFAKSHGIRTSIRGLRAVSDFEYELQIGYANATLWGDFETIYLMPSLENAFISSSIVRAVLNHNGDVSKLVPNIIIPTLKERIDAYFI
ncbi:Phosphopantetheine adenylyltransferase [Campylobacter majalis]|uniref:Phosphopantetheine adenylyltransferase n=1 Tax=Campylobacter majalis TaxID=2790656 RepID=A0ABN7KAC4_9BACT|nr:pantetheine-phosphate adenylyltransferase [Campylobacter majalis]CAD7287722.1 Phosphopantetheine adenylyltransferase [Campylobacter majalis]